jgi:hypothetical protein
LSVRLPDPPEGLADPRRVIAWMRAVQQTLEVELVALRTKKQERGEVLFLRPFTVAELPSPALPYKQIMVTDETGGPIPAFNDGTNWRRCSDRAIVS